MRLKLAEKDEIHGKIEQYWRGKEHGLAKEIQESQQRLWQLRNQLKNKIEAPKMEISSKYGFCKWLNNKEERNEKTNARNKRETMKGKTTTRSLSANT